MVGKWNKAFGWRWHVLRAAGQPQRQADSRCSSTGEDGVAQTHADRQTPPPPTPSTGSEGLLPRERCLFVVTTLEAWARLQSRHELYVLQSVL